MELDSRPRNPLTLSVPCCRVLLGALFKRQMSLAPIHRASRPRAPGALLAFLMLWASVGGIFHYSVVSHTRCADHGEIVHGDGAEEAAPPVRFSDGPNFLPEEPEQGDHGHEHCVFKHVVRARIVSALTEQVAPHSPALAPPMCASERPITTLALFRLAPKHSPPVRGSAQTL